MAMASPYYSELRRNEPKGRNFKRFEKSLNGAPKHLQKEIVVEKSWSGATLLLEALTNGAPASTCLDLIDKYPEACNLKEEVPLSALHGSDVGHDHLSLILYQ